MIHVAAPTERRRLLVTTFGYVICACVFRWVGDSPVTSWIIFAMALVTLIFTFTIEANDEQADQGV